MPYDTKEIANYFLEIAEKKGQTVSPMKLLKLLYFAHGWHLVFKNEPLLDSTIEAWQYGPVVPTIYHEFKKFGNGPITEKAVKIRVNNDIPTEHIPELSKDSSNNFVRALIEKVWEQYSPFSALQLSSMTHQEGTPWSDVFKEHNGAIPYGFDIDNDLMKKYFEKNAAKPTG